MWRLVIAVLLGAAACGGDDVDPPTTDAPPGGGPDAPPGVVPDGQSPGGIWHPPPQTTWQWQLTGTIDTSVDAEMFDLDLFDTDAALITELHGLGRVVICYFSSQYEDWRPDAGDFPAAALGNALGGWPGERWVDTRDAGVRDVMRARLDLAASKGCDGVEPDNVDGYQNDPGFPLSAATQLDYNRFLAAEAHALGLSVGLKNDPDQVAELVGDFDWSLCEECWVWSECDAYTPFIAAGKAVFAAEYTDQGATVGAVCPVTQPLGLSALLKERDLGAWREVCPYF